MINTCDFILMNIKHGAKMFFCFILPILNYGNTDSDNFVLMEEFNHEQALYQMS